jgi:hypothetical protein
VVSTAETYTLEIEIFTLNMGFQAQISRGGAQKKRLKRSVCGQSGGIDFATEPANSSHSWTTSIDPKLPFGGAATCQ